MTEFKKKLLNGQFVITVELTPPRGPDAESMVQKIKKLNGLVDAVNFTDNPSAKLRMCSMVACKISLDEGLEPILQMTCRDRNRIAIQSDLLGAHALGIRNLLVMTGDHPILGDHKEAKPVYDIDSSVLIKLVNNLNKGLDINGNKLDGKTDFFCGAVVNPNAEPQEPQLKRFEQKLRMGAKFFYTQMIFDIEKLERFMEYAEKFKVKIIAGVVIIKTKKMLHYLASKVPGVTLPEWLTSRIEKLNGEDIQNFGFDFAVSTILKIMDKKLSHGIHLVAIPDVEEMKKLLKFLKIGL